MVVSILLFFAGCGSNKVQSGQVSPPNNQVAETADSVLHNHHETSSGDTATTEVLSPPREASATIGNSEFRVKYSAPSVRDRVIWGGLVGYDRVWVSGAHMATSIQFNEDIYFNDNLVPAGKYAFFTIPGRDSWTVILNDNWNQHLADDYDPDLDVLRLNVVPEPHEFTEQLRYSVSGSPAGTGIMELAWEELKISIELRGPSI
ncbi:MAG: DUF2911 domain-containing protein [Balneolaceae bacterium]|nr:MAG: DUF2911 domain-containing protein [Balneolaceae bacterium]